MKFTYIICFILFFGTYEYNYACDCNYEGGFLKMSLNSKLITVVKVKKFITFKDINDEQVPMSMEVEVIEVVKGKESRKTFIIWGDNGNLCRPYLSSFQLGQYYIMSLNAASDGSKNNYFHIKERPKDYYISACGCYWLTFNKDSKTVYGDISKNKKEMKLTELKNKIKKTAS
ncbi:hypothetical protein [Chryseobacterium sp. C3]|uniref:hypothetical protein n=1 Tax=Chryseobacterium sp. C3 TaxID=2761532 RepID=UPI001623FFF1|nr:hypothetical protein [Chryseobacterium sp. C3]